MAYKIKMGHQRRPRGLAVLVDRAERAERRKEDMRRALAEAEREGVGLRAEKDRAAAHLVAVLGEVGRAEAAEELAGYDLRATTDRLLDLHAETLASMDRFEELQSDRDDQLTVLENDLDDFIRKGGK